MNKEYSFVILQHISYQLNFSDSCFDPKTNMQVYIWAAVRESPYKHIVLWIKTLTYEIKC
jgi:hypothetical protein